MTKRIADVVSVMDDLDIPKGHFFGNSMGGLVGFGVGVYAPDRFASLIIVGCNPYERTSWSDDEIALLRREMQAFVEAWEQEHGPAPPAAREHWLQNDGPALAAHLLAERRFPDLTAHVPAIRLPSLLCCGTEDDVYAQMRQAAEAMPNASFVALDRLDHLAAFRNGAQVLVPRIRAFLNEIKGDLQ